MIIVPVISRPTTETHEFQGTSPSGHEVTVSVTVPAGAGQSYALREVRTTDLSTVNTVIEPLSLWEAAGVGFLGNLFFGIIAALVSIILDWADWGIPIGQVIVVRIWLCLFPVCVVGMVALTMWARSGGRDE